MNKLISSRQKEKAFWGLMVIASLTYVILVTNILYALDISMKWILMPSIIYIVFCLIVLMYLRLKLWYDILTIWFNRKSEDERIND